MKLIDYVLGGTSVTNPNGSMSATVKNCSVVSGPGIHTLGNFPNALDFGTQGRIETTLNPATIKTGKFTIRTLFKIDTVVSQRQNIVESDCLPFALFIEGTTTPGKFKAVVSVKPKQHNWSGTTTEFFVSLQQATWYNIDLVYDTDTVAVFVDGTIQSVHAFPSGLIEKGTGTKLFIGTWVNGSGFHFNGQMAMLQWLNDEIPADHESQLDERRSHAEWFISYKEEQIKPTLNFGKLINKYRYNYEAACTEQLYEHGLIMYNEQAGAAFEMHGAIFAYYQTLNSSARYELGGLIHDEGNTTKAGGRKSLFTRGGLYWSPQTGTQPVTRDIYLEYENLNESAFLGWPTAPHNPISGGREQVFQGGRMYFKNGSPKAFEVHGAILAKYLQTGGPGTWGFPVSNESDLKNGASTIGKTSEFEQCTIYWTSARGAFEVHGDIRDKYRSLNGPLGVLGFPTSDEGDIPGVSGAGRFNTFVNGSILWFGNKNDMFVCHPFKIFLGRINSKESEGFGRGQNDMYLRAVIKDNGSVIHNQRLPETGDIGGKNVHDFNVTFNRTIVPNAINRSIEVSFDIWESDSPTNDDDHLGKYSKVLNMANAWGLREDNGVFNSGSFQLINSITWSVKPQVDVNALTTAQRWWSVANRSTTTLSKTRYAEAFRDVDSEPEWWDLSDWLEKAFYELVVKGLANGGNCFGMSVEAIYAYKNRSVFGLPIDRFNTWSQLEPEFNVKHQYQVGASAIWWFVGQFLSGNTHDPVDVFNATRSEFNRGCHPVVCIAQNYDFSGAPHCILPIAWNSSSKPWQMTILDPNFPGTTKTLFVDPDKNEFTYNAGNNYKGGEWSGGRFHYMPYSIIGERPRTPIWDAILLLLTGTVIILGSDTETVSLTDENGNDLDAFGSDSVKRLKEKKSLENKFVSIKGFDATVKKAIATKAGTIKTGAIKVQPAALKKGKGILASEMFLRSLPFNDKFSLFRPGAMNMSGLSTLTMGELAADKSFTNSLGALRSNQKLMNQIQNRQLIHVANDANLMKQFDSETRKLLLNLSSNGPLGKQSVHQFRGIRNGELVYAMKDKLNEFRLQAGIKTSELGTVHARDMGTSSSVVKMVNAQNKTVKLEITNKLGVGKDELRITIDKIPAAAGVDLNLNLRPGLAGLDILTTAQKINAQISIEGLIDNKVYKRSYGMDIEGGVRIRPSTVITNNELKVAKIDQLFGASIESKMIKGR